MRPCTIIAALAAIAFSGVTSTTIPSPADNGYHAQNTNYYDASKIPPTKDITAHLDATLDVHINADVHTSILGLLHADLDASVAAKGIPDVLFNVNAHVLPLIKDLSVKLDTDIEANAALDLAVEAFTQIKIAIAGAVIDIRAVVNRNAADCLNLNGKPITANVAAEIFAQLLNAVVLSAALAVKVCTNVDLAEFANIVTDITANFAVIVGLVGQVAANVNIDLKALVSVIVKLCVDLNLTALVNAFVGLGINVGAAASI
ncbi:hypothetical protein NP233_g5592 [Leucocoprinus birnbaumii]|uniref:Uncharacterized protein n=1 Tax=Leucocoprinus birnbaumii TaxID=56174 RepID=A0AAD5VSJ9_9AGAR|nr:hypothetical protein NP233_g5592 [Leucocoprinus birnbaumii]